MDNLAKVIMVTVRPGAIVPCIKILRGVYIAATEQGATFSVALTFQYKSGTVRPTVSSTVQVSALSFRQTLDPMWVRAQGETVELAQQPDTGALITCTAKVMIHTAAGEPIDCSFADLSNLPQVTG